ncbi:MAG: hypothetical protein HQL95_00715 [Magnetococcales bacterium]|nr:hypothetical protein [Magnetococcales bacterium]
MKIVFNAAGAILSAGNGAFFDGLEYAGELPADFFDTFALGKYTARQQDDVVTLSAVDGWVRPVMPDRLETSTGDVHDE